MTGMTENGLKQYDNLPLEFTQVFYSTKVDGRFSFLFYSYFCNLNIWNTYYFTPLKDFNEPISNINHKNSYTLIQNNFCPSLTAKQPDVDMFVTERTEGNCPKHVRGWWRRRRWSYLSWFGHQPQATTGLHPLLQVSCSLPTIWVSTATSSSSSSDTGDGSNRVFIKIQDHHFLAAPPGTRG